MSNTNKPDFLSKINMNLFAPSSLKVEAGKPYTFNTEISGSTGRILEKELVILSAKKIDFPE